MHWRSVSCSNARQNDQRAVLPMQIDAINDRFVEARDEIETARDDAETTYFNESYTEAYKVTEEASAPFRGAML